MNRNLAPLLPFMLALALILSFLVFFYGRFLKLTPAETELAAKNKIPQELALDVKRAAYNIAFLGTLNGDFSVLAGNDEDGADKTVPGIVIKAMQVKAELIPDEFASKASALGCLIYRSKQNFGKSPDAIAIIKSRDQYDILRAAATDGANYDISTEILIKKMKSWEKICRFAINGADYDWVSARFVEQPEDMAAFARALYKFCPDVVDQGTGSMEELEKEMKRTNSFYMWWD